MPIGLVGRKVGMTRIFTDEGGTQPVTVLDVSDNRVTQIKSAEKDGYAAVQVAFGKRRASRVNKAIAGHPGGRAPQNPKCGDRPRRCGAAAPARQGLGARLEGPRRGGAAGGQGSKAGGPAPQGWGPETCAAACKARHAGTAT